MSDPQNPEAARATGFSGSGSAGAGVVGLGPGSLVG